VLAEVIYLDNCRVLGVVPLKQQSRVPRQLVLRRLVLLGVPVSEVVDTHQAWRGLARNLGIGTRCAQHIYTER